MGVYLHFRLTIFRLRKILSYLNANEAPFFFLLRHVVWSCMLVERLYRPSYRLSLDLVPLSSKTHPSKFQLEVDDRSLS